jgi:hypothetical protein
LDGLRADQTQSRSNGFLGFVPGASNASESARFQRAPVALRPSAVLARPTPKASSNETAPADKTHLVPFDATVRL